MQASSCQLAAFKPFHGSQQTQVHCKVFDTIVACGIRVITELHASTTAPEKPQAQGGECVVG